MVENSIALFIAVVVFFRIIYLLLIKRSFLLYLRDTFGVIFFFAFSPLILKILIPVVYASPVEVFTFMSLAMPEIEKFNTLILNILAITIPTALGGGSLFLLGKEFFIASQKAVAESMFLGKALSYFALRSLSALSSGGNFPFDGGGGGVASGPELSQFLSKSYQNYVNSLTDYNREIVLKQLESTFKYYGTPKDLQKFYQTYFPDRYTNYSNNYFR